MALDNYDNLVQTLEDWTHRNDIDLRAQDCITLAEGYMFRSGYFQLKVKELEVSDSVAVLEDATESPLPARIIEFKKLELYSDGPRRYKLDARQSDKLVITDDKCRPYAYSIGSAIYFNSPADKDYTLYRSYYQAPLPLTDVNTTNIIIETYPELYLWGAMAAAFTYASEDDRSQLHGERFRQAIGAANSASMNLEWGVAPTYSIDGCIP